MSAEGTHPAVFPHARIGAHRPHLLHDSGRAWPQTNCYVDLWIELVAAWGAAPEAMLGFTLSQDYEIDHFTFFKVPLEDLETLYGITCTELPLYDTVENHVLTQLARGRMCLVELDSFHLPDTVGVTYQLEHGKTTVGVNRLDPAESRMEYFHNGGYFELSGEDYAGVFQHATEISRRWIPYTEFARFPETPTPEARQRTRSSELLRHHLRRRPAANPIRAFAEVFPAQVETVAERGIGFFHLYAFNTVRQFGANFELLAAHLTWLDPDRFADEVAAAQVIGDTAKAAQFLLARAVSRRRFDQLAGALTPAADAWDAVVAGLDAKA